MEASLQEISFCTFVKALTAAAANITAACGGELQPYEVSITWPYYLPPFLHFIQLCAWMDLLESYNLDVKQLS